MVVSARIRPWLDEDRAAGFPNAMFPRSQEQGVVDIHDLYNHPRGRPVLKSYNYQVDRLFDGSTTTEAIYEELVTDLIPFARDGGTATLFAYGQTGSGKTYTISRLEQLAIEALMASDGPDAPGPHREISVTVIELAGNAVFDLLSAERKPVAVRDDASGVTQLVGATEHTVTSKEEVLALVEQAASFRRSAPTFKNAASSRSHAICRIRIKQPQEQASQGNAEDNESSGSAKNDGFLYLIDLAGSEAARDVAVHGADRMREAREINMSLSVLKDCIRGKAEADAASAAAARLASSSNGANPNGKKTPSTGPRIPFRQAALTRILKHVFDPATTLGQTRGPSCKTVVIACVNPSLADVGASKNTLRYAELLRVTVPSSQDAVGADSPTMPAATPGIVGTKVPRAGPPATKKDTGSTAAKARNTRNPKTWDNAKLKEWIGRKVRQETLLPCSSTRVPPPSLDPSRPCRSPVPPPIPLWLSLS
ncbi:P-loop containing nucleoside triphosphate hydrolase protein [Microdochium trichocladiopsis]|uniref:P-loop containing nucleoside triphosphate hydrolase protein n=1 Tax=Microdochium trichocladiopsis TaxID=1682393 RepID=A0A9P8XY14_9PEZI|nr:P-loop containing nucleoside triphosphate hydrolase protein [Microdochium trichocladiopsis]KAH7024664.1 P-loop containing nucleoside triphosphate hydrolase protein [Microdochium trichocladiopsis]